MHVQAPHLDPAQAVSSTRSGATPAREPARTSTAPATAPVDTTGAVREAVAAINRAAKSLSNSVELSLDERSERAVVRIVDAETGQLIRQIPSEEVLELRRALDRIAGLLIHRTA